MERGKGAAAADDDEALVPGSATDALHRSLAAMDGLRAHLLDLLPLADPADLAELPPLARARAFLALAQAASSLLSVRLRCGGVRPESHPIKTELERLSLYKEKLDKFTEWSKAPLHPSTKVNPQAAARFIGHSLPDLTPEQRQSMRNISRKDGTGSGSFESHRSQKRRKCQPRERQSVRDAAKEFLEKAARELLGTNDRGVKGPLRNDVSGEEDGEREVNLPM